MRSQTVTLATGERAVAIGGSADSAVIVTGDRNLVITATDAEAIHELMGTRPRNEKVLLKDVKDEVQARLNQSLHNAVLINLGKEQRSHQVNRPWDAEVKIGKRSSEPLPANISILEVFERSDVSGKLLILGEPGSGKTTTMLTLAQALTEKAEIDSNYPIPVLLNLSAWKNTHQQMKDWLIAELKLKYGVRLDIGKRWIEEKQLLPLLDGLDEVRSEHQEACVKAINQLLQSQERPLYAVVCSQREEYELYGTRLQLNGAIRLQDLSDRQLETYLMRMNHANLWQLIQPDAALLELVRKPLLLNITILASEQLNSEQWHRADSTKARLKFLFNAYVQQMFSRELNSRAYRNQKQPSEEQARQWLVSLARRLQQESQTEFLIERIQPSLLQSRQTWAYRLIFWLSVFLILNLGSLPILSLISRMTSTLLIPSTSMGAILMLSFFIMNPDRISLVEAIQPSISHLTWQRISEELCFSLKAGLLIGLSSAVSFGLITRLYHGLSASLILGLFVGLFFGLILALIAGLKADIETRNRSNQGVWNSAQNAVVLLAISIPFAIILNFLLPQLLDYFLDTRDLRATLTNNGINLRAILFNEGNSRAILANRNFRAILANRAIFTNLIIVANIVPVPILVIPYIGGGMACIQHFSLRVVLFLSGKLP